MGTTYSVTFAKPPDRSLSGAISAVCARLDELFSTYRAGSEVSRFNAFHGGDWFQVSDDTAAVVEIAQSVSRLSDGAFDITVDPLVRLWGFGAHRAVGGIPSADSISRTKQHISWKRIEVRRNPSALRKLDPELSIDLSGVAKGYAADALAALVEKEGIPDYLVAVGGELRGHGDSSHARPWHVGIEEPLDQDRAIRCVVELRNAALSTSGDYRNFRISNGRRYCHIVDPRKGSPVGDEVASVSVIADRGAYADALATALMVLGPEAGYRLAVEKDIACLFLLRTPNGVLEKATPRFEKLRVRR